jgi:hypothetical protein
MPTVVLADQEQKKVATVITTVLLKYMFLTQQEVVGVLQVGIHLQAVALL